MRCLVVASLLAVSSAVAAQTDLSEVETKSRAIKRARLQACGNGLKSLNLPWEKFEKQLFKCGDEIFSFSAREHNGKPELSAITTQQTEGPQPVDMSIAISCSRSWSMVAFTPEIAPTMSDKLQSKVTVSYKIGNSQPVSGQWDLRDGMVAVNLGPYAKRFIDTLRGETQTEILVELLTHDRRLQVSYKLENILDYRELHLKFCQ